MSQPQPVHPKFPPGQNELPSGDGEPMETPIHRLQMNVLIDSLEHAWSDRTDFYVGGNMFVYFSDLQLKHNEFRGPDVFVAMNTERKPRKSWVAWEEGQLPDLVIELASQSTREFDRTEKKRIYAKTWRLPEYFLFDPDTGEIEAWRLDPARREYLPLLPDENGDYPAATVGLKLGRRITRASLYEGNLLRWIEPNGKVLPTGRELAEEQRARAEEQRARAEEQRARAELAEARVRELEAKLGQQASS